MVSGCLEQASILDIRKSILVFVSNEFNPPSLIKRYIDDIGSVFNDMSNVKLFVETYNAIRPNSIVLTYEISLKEGIFLDLEIY